MNNDPKDLILFTDVLVIGQNISQSKSINLTGKEVSELTKPVDDLNEQI